MLDFFKKDTDIRCFPTLFDVIIDTNLSHVYRN